MQRFRAGDLSFTTPKSWKEVTIGQYIALLSPDSPTDAAYIITTLSGLPESHFRNKKVPFDLSAFVLKHLSFLKYIPEPDEALPKSLVIDGKKIKLPTDLGAEATLGQMWDIDMVIRERTKDNLPVDPATMAQVLLCVFLWPMLRDTPYTHRYDAAELWPQLSGISCIEGLAIAGFFLRNTLAPTNSGKVSSISMEEIRPKKLRQILRLVWQHLTNTSPALN